MPPAHFHQAAFSNVLREWDLLEDIVFHPLNSHIQITQSPPLSMCPANYLLGMFYQGEWSVLRNHTASHFPLFFFSVVFFPLPLGFQISCSKSVIYDVLYHFRPLDLQILSPKSVPWKQILLNQWPPTIITVYIDKFLLHVENVQGASPLTLPTILWKWIPFYPLFTGTETTLPALLCY